MKKLEDILDEMNVAKKADASVKEFLNWLLAISIGIFYLGITEIRKLNLSNYYLKNCFIIIMIVSMTCIFIAGLVKYFFYRREIKMNIHEGKLKKLKLQVDYLNKNTLEAEAEIRDAFENLMKEYNRIRHIYSFIDPLNFLTLFLVLITGLVIVITTIQC